MTLSRSAAPCYWGCWPSPRWLATTCCTAWTWSGSGAIWVDTDCFACHAAFTGADSGKCVSCHQPADIGRRTTQGAPVLKPLTFTPFHQELISQDCVACHSDHAGVKRYRLQGYFDHALLKKETNQQCQTCHKSPTDALHQQITGNCAQCHGQQKWTPATFEHDKYFVLDRDHTSHQGQRPGRPRQA